jgi:hypothetical protein
LSLPAGYQINYIGSDLTIAPATLTYVANPISLAFGSSIPTLTGGVTGFVSGDTLASATSGTLNFSTTATASSQSGVYPIDGSGLSANYGNYVFGQAPANATALTIEPASLNPSPPNNPRPVVQNTPQSNVVFTSGQVNTNFWHSITFDTTTAESTPPLILLQPSYPNLTLPAVPNVIDTTISTLSPILNATKVGLVSNLLDVYELIQAEVSGGPTRLAETGINVFMVDVPTAVVSAIPIIGIPAGMATGYTMSKVCNSLQCGPTVYNTIETYGAQANAPLGTL